MKRPLLYIALMFVSGLTVSPAQEQSPAANRWNKQYRQDMYTYGKEPIQFLKDQISRLGKGTALCLAAGEGRNAVYLAQQGFDVTAVDFSDVGLQKTERLAAERGVTITTILADLNTFDMGDARWDLITNIYYYQPDLFPGIIKALKPGGAFLLETFSADNPSIASFGPKNPDYLAKPNELLPTFSSLRILHYEDTVADLNDGMHKGKGAIVRLIAQKPLD